MNDIMLRSLQRRCKNAEVFLKAMSESMQLPCRGTYSRFGERAAVSENLQPCRRTDSSIREYKAVRSEAEGVE